MTAPEQIRLKRLFASSVGGSWGNPPEEEGIAVPCVRGTDLDFQRLQVDLTSAPMRSYSAAEIQYRGAAAGDIIIEKSGGGENQPVGRVGLYGGLSTVMPTNFAGRLRPRSDQDPRYLTYLLAAQYFAGRTRAAIKQTTGIQNLEVEVLLATRVPRFPQMKQRAIADYLDVETARIDALITKKRRMIELLEERWASLVTSAVAPDGSLTNGAGKNAWPTAAFGSVVHIAEGQVDPRSEPWASMLLLAPNHIESRTGRLLGMETAKEQGAISGKYVCEPGDVVYSKIRPALAKAVLATDHWLCSADMYPLRAGPALLPDFLRIVVLSPPFTDLATMESERVAMPKINRDALGRVRLPVPSIEQQVQIVRRVASATERRDATTAALLRQVSLLAEHRQALITSAVTGELAIPVAA